MRKLALSYKNARSYDYDYEIHTYKCYELTFSAFYF